MSENKSPMKDDTSHWKYYSWTNVFNREECLEIGEYIDNNYQELEDASRGAFLNGKPIKNISSVKHIKYGQIKHLISPFINEAFHIAQKGFGYLTNGPHDEEMLLFNTYYSDNKDSYDWHFDESFNSLIDCKLTLLMNLSTEVYKGGDFETYIYEKEKHNSINIPGSCFMIKSHFNHRVLPVTEGTRKTLVFFISGPRFR